MRVRLVGTTLLAVTLVSALAASPFQQQKTALVTVVAEAGGPVASLTANDFVVREDRATRQVVAAERSAEPIFVTLLVDTLAPPMGAPSGAAGFSQTQDLRRALTSFVTAIKGGSPDAQIARHGVRGRSGHRPRLYELGDRDGQVHPACISEPAGRRCGDRGAWSTPPRSSATSQPLAAPSSRSTSIRGTRAPCRR